MEDETESKSLSVAEIRKLKRAGRNALTARSQEAHSNCLQQLVIQEKAYRNSQHIACYIANDGEIDPLKIIEHAWFNNKDIYLPILSPLKNSLYFAAYTRDSKFRLNRFNIPEPICHPSQWKKANQLDLLLLPLVAFDDSGNRIGMGGGFYDRTLAYMRHRQHWKKPALIGLAHELQKAAQLDRHSWDIPLDLIITEKQRYKA